MARAVSAPAGTRIAWAPNEGRQTEFLESSAFEVLYGGARGGGKSEAMLAEACRQAVPEGVLPRVLELHPELSVREAMELAREACRSYQAIIFRRTMPEIQDLIRRARNKIPAWVPGAVWRKQEATFAFPSGAVLLFRYLRYADDWHNYQGHEYQFLGYEELTNFDEAAYINVIGSCRSSSPYLLPELRATCNPGGRGHGWVRARFVDPAPWGDIFWDPSSGLTRQFIPAGIKDNPKLGLADPDYIRRLRLLPEREQRAMIDGDWDAWEGAVFAFSRDLHVVNWEWLATETGLPLGQIPDHWPIVLSYDWGFSKPFSCGWWTVDGYGRMIRLREWYGCARNPDGSPRPNEGLKLSDPAIAAGILEREAAWGWGNRRIERWADPSMFNPRQISHDLKGPPLEEVYEQHGVKFERADNNRIAGKAQLHTRLELTPIDADHDTPAILIMDGCLDWIRTVPALPLDEKNPEDVDSKAEDHTYDETRYALMSRVMTPVMREARKPKRQPKRGQGWQRL